MSAMTRGFGAAIVVGVLALAGAAGCGGSDAPSATRTAPSSASTTTSPSPTPSPTPEAGLSGPTVVAVRELSDGSRVLVAYDLDEGTTRELAPLEPGDYYPTVDVAGTSVVVASYGEKPSPDAEYAPAHLVLVDLATGERRPLTERKDEVTDSDPQWNRAGDGWVYFLHGDPHTAGLWRVDVNTGEVEEVLNGAGVFWGGFALEPGGGSIFVGSPLCWFDKTSPCPSETGFPAEFTRLDLATGNVARHPFKGDSRWPIGDVAWTPDGAWFAHTQNRDELLIKRWPDGTPRTLLTLPVYEGATTWHSFGDVGWHPDGSLVVLADSRLAYDSTQQYKYGQLRGRRILIVDTADGSAFPIGPASVQDLSFDVWSPPDD
jgi:Tol biopolymer transport system component